MAFLDPMDLGFDDGDDLSTAMSTETLADYDPVPEEFAGGSDKSQLPTQRIAGREFLVVEQSASLRDGTEIRALDRPDLDRHWLCNLCLPAQYVFKISDGPSVLQRSYYSGAREPGR
jgi:hypothetical protein